MACNAIISKVIPTPRGDSLLVSDGGGGGSDIFGFVKRCLAYLWVYYLVHYRYIIGVADGKI